MRRAWSLVLAAVLALASCASIAATRWVDEALLHDGRRVEVERSVTFTFGSGELSDAFRRSPTEHAFSVAHPDTGKSIRWEGPRHFNPVMLDFWQGTPHLVIVAYSVFGNLARFGCPEIPYVFLRNDAQANRWVQVPPKEFPARLLRANLSIAYEPAYMGDGKRQSAQAIDRMNAATEASSSRFLSRTIPVDFASWGARHKNHFRVGRHQDGCRHTVPSNEDRSHAQAPGQPSQAVHLEVLETRVHDPELVMGSEEWSRLAFDTQRDARCRTHVRLVGESSERPELRGWLVFTQDATGTRKARPGAALLCDADALWIVEYGPDRERVYLTSFTLAGELRYRLHFTKPDAPGGYLGSIMAPTFRREGGHLAFEWWNTNQSGRNRHVKRAMKVRLAEPASAAAS